MYTSVDLKNGGVRTNEMNVDSQLSKASNVFINRAGGIFADLVVLDKKKPTV